MSYLSELTAHERLTVDNATLDMFTAFENGSDLIYDIWEQYFSDRERKNIESRDLEFIGRILYSVYDRMSNAIRDYHLMLGHYDAPGVQCFIDTAKRAQLTIDAVKASEHARNEMRTAAYDLDDADAIKLLTGKGGKRMKLLYCARCTTPLMSAATVFICPCCGAAYRQRGTRFSFVADLSGVSVKELMQSMEVTL